MSDFYVEQQSFLLFVNKELQQDINDATLINYQHKVWLHFPSQPELSYFLILIQIHCFYHHVWCDSGYSFCLYKYLSANDCLLKIDLLLLIS